MLKNNVVLVLTAHQPYIHSIAENRSIEQELFFSAITDTYLPLLQLFSELESTGVPFKLSMCLSPSFCSQLSNPLLISRYEQWLDRLITFGESECLRYSDHAQQGVLAAQYLASLKEKKHAFTTIYDRNLLSKFAYYAERGNIELLATAGTFAYMPLYTDIKEALCAQIESGLIAHRQYFSVNPEGFWLPYMGYASGLESILRSYGFSYTILDSHGLLFASPVPSKGVFAPVRCANNAFSIFARDYRTPDDVLEEPTGFMFDEAYRNQNRDVAFEIPPEQLADFLGEDKVRLATGFKYWSNKSVYVPEVAAEQVQLDAARFLDEKAQKLSEASKLTGGSAVSLVCCFDAHTFGQKWYEGIDWLGSIFKTAAQRSDLALTQCSSLLQHDTKNTKDEKIAPFPSAALGSGYGEDLLDNSNDWMLRYIRKAIERMVDLTDRFPDDSGLKERSLNFAAKEVLLAMGSDWPKMVHDQYFVEYAFQRLKEHIASFTTVYDSLGSNAISTEWLTHMEKEHPIFPWINYRIFRTKK